MIPVSVYVRGSLNVTLGLPYPAPPWTRDSFNIAGKGLQKHSDDCGNKACGRPLDSPQVKAAAP